MAGYLDIDSLLSEEERVPCIFNLDGSGMGHIDSSNDADDILAGAKIDLPLWLANSLYRHMAVDIDLPKHFERKMRDDLSASASNINLRDYSHYFFEVGLSLAMAKGDNDLRIVLTKAFAGDRFEALMVQALSRWNDDNTQFSENLTSTELALLNEGIKASRDIHHWRLQNTPVLRKSSILGSRKFSERLDFDLVDKN